MNTRNKFKAIVNYIYNIGIGKFDYRIGKFEFIRNRFKEVYVKTFYFSIQTKKRIEEMIQKHQKLPGSIFDAFLDRFRKTKTE